MIYLFFYGFSSLSLSSIHGVFQYFPNNVCVSQGNPPLLPGLPHRRFGGRRVRRGGQRVQPSQAVQRRLHAVQGRWRRRARRTEILPENVQVNPKVSIYISKMVDQCPCGSIVLCRLAVDVNECLSSNHFYSLKLAEP